MWLQGHTLGGPAANGTPPPERDRERTQGNPPPPEHDRSEGGPASATSHWPRPMLGRALCGCND